MLVTPISFTNGCFLCFEQSDCKIVSDKAKLTVLKTKYCYNTFGHSICGCLFLFMWEVIEVFPVGRNEMPFIKSEAF